VDTPDLERFNRYRNASFELVEKHCEILANPKQPMPHPDPIMNLELATEMIKGDLQRAEAEGAPEEVLERYRNYLLEVAAIQETEGMAAPMPGAMPGEGAGPLPPAPPPEALGAPGEGMPGAMPMPTGGGY
jgi:hypothetical protein